MGEQSAWAITTHDWSTTVDPEHLRLIREQARDDAPAIAHLVLETLAYADDEAESLGRTGRPRHRTHRPAPTKSSGTTVRFHPDDHVVIATTTDPGWYAAFRWLTVDVVIE